MGFASSHGEHADGSGYSISISDHTMGMKVILPKRPKASRVPLMFFETTSVNGLDSALDTID